MADPRYRFEPILYEAITPLHVGAGQDVGLVDLPVVRERTTDHPYLPGSGIRGALRDRCEAEPALTTRLFGSEGDEEIRSGCVSVLDAHLLLFPVRSYPGLYHWITCSFAISRHRTLYRHLTGRELGQGSADAPPAAGRFLGTSSASPLYLEEYPFTRGEGEWSWTLDLPEVDPSRVVLLDDADFLHFVRHATIVRQRNRLSTAKTVLRGALFSVEMLPAESWFGGFVGATAERVPTGEDAVDPGEAAREAGERSGPPRLDKDEASRELRRLLTGSSAGGETFVTLGGDESTGLGITRMHWRTAP